MTSWDSVNCSDVEYLVEISGRILNSPQALMEVSSYWLHVTYYEFPLPCSTAYNLTVRSRNSAGVSEPSSAFAGVTGNVILHLTQSAFLDCVCINKNAWTPVIDSSRGIMNAIVSFS